MKEKEYNDTRDLVLLRNVIITLRDIGCYENPNKTRLLSVKENINLMIESLELDVENYLDNSI